MANDFLALLTFAFGIASVLSVGYLVYWDDRRPFVHFLPYAFVTLFLIGATIENGKFEWLGVFLMFGVVASMHGVYLFEVWVRRRNKDDGDTPK